MNFFSDIDECEGNSDICGTYNVPAAGNEPAASVSRGQCVNTEGSFVCDCAEGFQFQSDSHPKCQGQRVFFLPVIIINNYNIFADDNSF